MAMIMEKTPVASGIEQLDDLLGGLYIGDNVVWHDDAGSLASVFYMNFLNASRIEEKPIIYASFDRSPKVLMEKLGRLTDYPGLTVLDCFTEGKGASSPLFLKFYEEDAPPADAGSSGWTGRTARNPFPRHCTACTPV
jgi:KaiC/GvpD/RAD55 family RecA-like ATPase